MGCTVKAHNTGGLIPSPQPDWEWGVVDWERGHTVDTHSLWLLQSLFLELLKTGVCRRNGRLPSNHGAWCFKLWTSRCGWGASLYQWEGCWGGCRGVGGEGREDGSSRGRMRKNFFGWGHRTSRSGRGGGGCGESRSWESEGRRGHLPTWNGLDRAFPVSV